MMDFKLVFCEAKSLASTITSEVLDFTQEMPNSGTYPLYMILRFPQAGTGAGSTNSVTFKLQDSADGSSDWKDVAVTPAIAGVDLKGVLVLPMPMKHRRYVKLVTTVEGTVTGTVTAYISDQYPIAVDYKIEGFHFTEPTA